MLLALPQLTHVSKLFLRWQEPAKFLTAEGAGKVFRVQILGSNAVKTYIEITSELPDHTNSEELKNHFVDELQEFQA